LKIGYIKSELLHVTNSGKIDIQHLPKQDVVVVWRGSMVVGKNETKRVLTVYRNLRQKIINILY